MTFPTLPMPTGRFANASDAGGNVQRMNLADFQAANPNATVYIPSADFQCQYNGTTINLQANQPFVVTADLLTFLNSLGAPIVYAWGPQIILNTAAASQYIAALVGQSM
jgi:hypothetical protein